MLSKWGTIALTAVFGLSACQKVQPAIDPVCDCKNQFVNVITSTGEWAVAPNVFTPNGDGKNDVYRFKFSPDFEVDSFSLTIIWPPKGEVYFTKSRFESWNGFVKSGTGVDAKISGQYFTQYYIRTKDGEVFSGCGCFEIPTYSSSEGCILNKKDTWIFADQFDDQTGKPTLQTIEKFCN